MERLILVRHGESELGVQGRVNGDASVAGGLTERGRRQAQALADELRHDPIELCVVTGFERTAATAELALAGRDVPRLVVSELNEIRYGRFEGGPVSEYLRWAWTAGSGEECPGGGESRLEAARRIARGYRAVLARPERVVLLVGHGLSVRYLLEAAEGRPPPPRVERVPEARAFRLERRVLERALEVIETWCAAPSW